jgi:histidinol dehydrogenase
MELKASPLRLEHLLCGPLRRNSRRVCTGRRDTDAAIEQRVADILADVQRRGDAAVIEYTNRFDRLSVRSMQELELGQASLKAAFEAIPAAQREALQAAARRIRSYHEAQKKAGGESWSYRDEDGTCSARRSRRLTGLASMCPAARQRIRRAC